MSLRLTEQIEPADARSMLYVEPSIDSNGAFMIICRADEDPNKTEVGETIALNHEQLVSLKRYIDKLLTE